MIQYRNTRSSSPLRTHFSTFLLLLAVCSPLFVITARAAQHAAATSDTSLPLCDENGRAVWGVVCDNLPDTPAEEESAVFSELPVGWQAADVEYSLCNPDGSRTDKIGNPNIGQLEWLADGRHLRYLPPLEFNFQQMPDEKSVERRPFPITAALSRIVRLTIRDKATHGQALSATRDIVLKRPTVVLVHGINSDPSVWVGSHRDGVGAALVADAFPVAALDSSGRAYRQAGKSRRKNKVADDPSGYFNGNGPVEFFAANLGQLIASRLAQVQRAGYVAHRVDIVAHSYGSLVARWYLKTVAGAAAPDSRHWYVNSKNDPRGADLYSLPDWFWEGAAPPNSAWQNRSFKQLTGLAPQSELIWTGPSSKRASTPPASGGVPVRKLITIAGIWRGVPLCNYLNEIRGPAHQNALGGRSFYDAPLDGYLHRLAPTVGSFADRQLDEADHLPTKVPSMEVMAVNSRWMQCLNDRPFFGHVAYGSVAGDDSRLISILRVLDLDPYTTISHYQQPSWFPGLKLERYNKGAHNLTDGVVPLWSAALSASDLVVSSHHTSILRNPQTTTYVLAALCTGILPEGDRLNVQWGNAVVSRVWDAPQERFKYWDFKESNMAPEPQNNEYRLVEPDGVLAAREVSNGSAAVARIAPQALLQLPPLKNSGENNRVSDEPASR
jgi:pimeloyl-ACP methyl ester carboxylesterase